MDDNDTPRELMDSNQAKYMESLSLQADKLIKRYAFGSSLTGFIPFPLLDTLGLIGVQRIMLLRLSRLYNIEFSKHLAKTWLTTLMSGMALKVASPMVGSALKMIPGVGTLIGGASMAALGGATTYAVGKVFQHHFESGGTLKNFEPEKAKKMFDAELDKGKELSSRGKR